jgi:RNA polymerase sigma-70 factor (ECF subfamily)
MQICLARNRPGPYQLQAAINAVHSDAPSGARTDWRQILVLYNQLMAIAPSAVVALNRAVAVAEVHGVEHALQLVEAIELPKYHLYHAVRADLLRRIGRTADAATAYRLALDNCENKRERDFLRRQCQSLKSH